MKKPRVALLLSQNIPSYWAHSFNVMKMAQGFKNIGCDVEVLTAESEKSKRLKNEIKDIYTHYGVEKSIPITYLEPSPEAFTSGKTLDDPTFSQRVCRYVREKDFDFLYCRNNVLITYEATKEGIPTFMETHSTKYGPNKWRGLAAAAHLDSFKALVTIHKKIKEKLMQQGIPEHKILVLEDGVHLQNFQLSNNRFKWRKKLGLDPQKQYVVYCGHLYQEKGIEIILQAARRLQDQQNIAFLLVGGNIRDQARWEAYCQKYRIGNVTFTGFVPNSSVPRYLKAADCLLLAYKLKNIKYRIMNVHTTSPLKLFEYMASRRPIVATNLPTIRKVLTHQENALLVPPDDLGDFCQGIMRLLNDQNLSAKLAKQAYKDVQQYTWEKRCAAIMKLYE